MKDPPRDLQLCLPYFTKEELAIRACSVGGALGWDPWCAAARSSKRKIEGYKGVRHLTWKADASWPDILPGKKWQHLWAKKGEAEGDDDHPPFRASRKRTVISENMRIEIPLAAQEVSMQLLHWHVNRELCKRSPVARHLGEVVRLSWAGCSRGGARSGSLHT